MGNQSGPGLWAAQCAVTVSPAWRPSGLWELEAQTQGKAQLAAEEPLVSDRKSQACHGVPTQQRSQMASPLMQASGENTEAFCCVSQLESNPNPQGPVGRQDGATLACEHHELTPRKLSQAPAPALLSLAFSNSIPPGVESAPGLHLPSLGQGELVLGDTSENKISPYRSTCVDCLPRLSQHAGISCFHLRTCKAPDILTAPSLSG